MLLTQQFLKQHGVDAITSAPFFLKVSRHHKYPNLVCFNYNQILSPRTDPIICECRGLILDENRDWEVVSFPYTRYFNHGEHGAANIDWNTASVFEKLDGSLVQMYWYDDRWHFATRGMPDAAGEVNGFKMTFVELIEKTFHENGYDFTLFLPHQNYFFELCTPFNKVVVEHSTSKLILHGVRDRVSLKEISIKDIHHVQKAQTFKFNTIEDIVRNTHELNGCESEGFIVVDNQFNRLKLKSPQYVALSHLKDSLSDTRILEILLTNESDEFLTYFPEFTDLYCEWKKKVEEFISKSEVVFNEYNHIENQKEFAMKVKHFPFSSLVFAFRSGHVTSGLEWMRKQTINSLKQIL